MHYNWALPCTSELKFNRECLFHQLLFINNWMGWMLQVIFQFLILPLNNMVTLERFVTYKFNLMASLRLSKYHLEILFTNFPCLLLYHVYHLYYWVTQARNKLGYIKLLQIGF